MSRTFSTEHKEKLSEAKRGKNHPNYGKPRSEETRRKIGSGSLKKFMNNPLNVSVYTFRISFLSIIFYSSIVIFVLAYYLTFDPLGKITNFANIPMNLYLSTILQLLLIVLFVIYSLVLVVFSLIEIRRGLSNVV